MDTLKRSCSNHPKRQKSSTHWNISLIFTPGIICKSCVLLTLSLAHCMVCSMTAGKDFRVQNGISSSGGSLWETQSQVKKNLIHKLAIIKLDYVNTYTHSHGCCTTQWGLGWWSRCALSYPWYPSLTELSDWIRSDYEFTKEPNEANISKIKQTLYMEKK